MLTQKEFIQKSLEVNLFFLRIMKEHLFFIETGMPHINEDLIQEADILKRSLEILLSETVDLADGAIREEVLDSNELVTPYTLEAEKVTSKLTGPRLDTDITKREMELTHDPNFDFTYWLEGQLENINMRAKNLLLDTIAYKKKVLEEVTKCELYTTLYPEMQSHLIAEAEYYLELLKGLKERKLPEKELCDILNFWNYVMMDHAQFIEGFLDPSEEDLKEMAKKFIKAYDILIRECERCSRRTILEKSTRATRDIVEYKMAATEGILACDIKSIILPLLADHVLREANHYLRLLKDIREY